MNNHFKVLLNNDNLKFNADIETYEDLQANKIDKSHYILPYYILILKFYKINIRYIRFLFLRAKY